MDNVEKITAIILPILRRYGVTRAGLFGSVVRDEMHEDSDIDLLVEISADLSLLDMVGLKLEIEAALNRKVDLVEYCTLKPHLRERILSEQRVIVGSGTSGFTWKTSWNPSISLRNISGSCVPRIFSNAVKHRTL